MKIACVVNPRSAGGRTGRDVEAITQSLRERLGGDTAIFVTERPQHATALTREALQGGAEQIVGVGGDGTINEVVNGFFEDGRPIAPAAVLSVVPSGTGGDLRRSLGLGRGDGLDRLGGGVIRSVDVGRSRSTGPGGELIDRMFLNVGSLGLSGVVARLIERRSWLKSMGGRVGFFLATAAAMSRWRDRPIRVRVDDHFDAEMPLRTVAVANAGYFGGGMRIAPQAQMDDGLFDVVMIGEIPIARVIIENRRLYDGRILEVDEVRSIRGKRVEVSATEPTLAEVDGEAVGGLPVRYDILPATIRVRFGEAQETSRSSAVAQVDPEVSALTG